jgi:hypothetical protein
VGRHNKRRHDRKLFQLRDFISVTLLPMLPSVLLSCRPFIPSQHSDRAFQTSCTLASCLSHCSSLNAMPLSNMHVPYSNNGAMKMRGQPLWPRLLWGNGRSTPPNSLIPPLIPIVQPTKLTMSNATAVLLVPPSMPPSCQLSCPLLPCCPLPLSSRHAAPCCHCLCCATRHRAAPCCCHPAMLKLFLF